MINRFLTCKVSGFLIFLCVMVLIFHLTFNVIGKSMQELLMQLIEIFSESSEHMLIRYNAPLLLRSLILEQSGYLSFAAMLMDKPMKRLGLTGLAIVPLISGFGCNVPAVMTASSLLRGREKLTVMAMIPFMSCSARLPIYAIFISAFFEDHRLLALAGVYLTGIAIAVLLSFLTKTLSDGTAFYIKDAQHPVSSPVSTDTHARSILRTTLRNVWQNCAGFVKKACTVVLLASVIIWLLRTFGPDLNPVEDVNNSLLAALGKAAMPLFMPLGFDDWQTTSALISGLFAKETIISTLAMLSASGSRSTILLTDIFTPLSAFCFMVFCLLYIPCIPTLAAIRKETGSIKFCSALCLFQLVTAWLVSFLLFQAGRLF